jgi:stearoyl-CoA desaturase (delta-9 desaturase)
MIEPLLQLQTTPIAAKNDSAKQNSKSPFQPTLMSRIMAPSLAQGKILQAMSFTVFMCTIFLLQADESWWFAALFVYFLTGCLGQSVTFHRALAHRSVTFSRPVEMVFTMLGTLGGTMSSIAFVGMHRTHHAFSDQEKDPHAIQRKGWRILFSSYEFDVDPRFVKDLLRDPFHRFLHKYYTVILVLWASFLLVLSPMLCVFCFFIPVFWQITISNLGNILTHRQGYRNYDLPDQSRNNVLITILAWGEGWHNNHHASPSSWNLGHKWWEFDPGAAVISVLCGAGLVSVGRRQAHPTPVAAERMSHRSA